MLRGTQQAAKCFTRSFHTGRAMRFEWQKLVTPFTSKAWVAEMQGIEKDLGTKSVACNSLPATVAPIDWAKFEEEIETDGVVAELKAEYEAMVFPKAQADGSEISAEAEAKMIADAEADVRMAKYELAAADRVLAQMRKAKLEGQTWTHDQWESYMPGYNAQYEADYEDEEYLPSANSVRLHGTDFKEVTKRIQAGDKTVADELQCDGLVGDVSTAEEQAFIEKGEWSVARLFAGKEERAAIQAELTALKSGK